MVSGAWAGASLVPGDEAQLRVPDKAAQKAGGKKAAPAPTPPADPAKPTAAPPDPASLPEGQVLAGAAKTSIAPRPDDYNGTWETSPEKCATLSESSFNRLMDDPAEMGDHLAAAGSPWPENPNCIYMGGFGIGPMNPVTSFDEELGLWVRAVAFATATATTSSSTVIDGEGWLWDYASKCDDCGAKQIAAALAADDGARPRSHEDIVIAATHSHASPDFIGGWGFVPDWYMEQVTDAIKRRSAQARADACSPAVLEVGESEARPFNRERRDTYRSAEEQQLAWLRAVRARRKKATSTIATLGAYAAHPTTSAPTTAWRIPTGWAVREAASRSASAASACTS